MGSARSNLRNSILLVVVFHFLAAGGAESEVRGQVGGSVELQCGSLPSDPAASPAAASHVVEWVREGLDISVLIKFGSHHPRVHPNYEGRVTLVRTTSLRLDGLRLDDQGAYECRILLLDKPSDVPRNGTRTVLSVTAPPTFIQTPPPVVDVLIGSPFSLVCLASGNPAPTITWQKDGSFFQNSGSQEGALSLRAASMQSAGQYTCHASNSEGNVTHVTKVTIKGPPVIVIPPRNTSLNMSQNALLRCQAVADPPNMTYVWLKDGENVYHMESLKSRVKIMVDGTLLISSLIPEDSGNYTCVPTNGLLTPPTASANLTVKHPAKSLAMPKETFLPTGMAGVISCPAAAQPPLLRVDWTKDGELLDLSLYPGWSLKPRGSLFMATVNDDAAGTYTCTPYNSYGTMGPSGLTNVILQDPPSFSNAPENQYRRDTGGTLLIPCQANPDPTNKISWSKVNPIRRISYSIERNGSLLLQPLSKDHQGAWECRASNRVASVKATTQVFVLGTSPHAATSLSVSPGVRQVNVSWEAGFDGGSAQTFSVWVKKISASHNDLKRDWFSVPVPPPSGTRLQVTGLSPSTSYQFSILSRNKMGTGPFSDIAIARTLGPTRRRNKPKPPTSLVAHQGPAGVVLQWSPPDAQQTLITGFVLQSRTEQGDWFNLDEDISANASEIVVPGLRKDCVYELRLLSRRGELLSEPGPSVNVSTIGMEIYPATSRLLEFVPEPLLAGVLSGVGFMILALVLLLGFAYAVSHKRDRRRRRKKDEPPTVIYKCSPSMKTSGTSSPDSVLKKSLLPANSLYPTSSSTTTSSSLQTDCSSFSSENHHRRKQFMSKYSQGSLAETTSALTSPHIEMICRGPDGRFVIPQYDDALSVHSKKSVRHDQASRVRRSVSLHSEREDGKGLPFVLSVDLPPCKAATDSGSQTCGMPLHLPYCTSHLVDRKASYDRVPDLSSMCSNSSLSTILHHNRELTPSFHNRELTPSFHNRELTPSFHNIELTPSFHNRELTHSFHNRELTPSFPVLPHIKSGFGQPSMTASNLVLQMEHERERANLSRCLKLAQEREELERELQRYTLERTSMREIKRGEENTERTEDSGDESMWKYKSKTLPHRYPRSNKENPFSSSSAQWKAGSQVSSPCLIPSRTRLSLSSPASCFKSGPHRPSSFFANQTSLRSEEAGRFSKDRLTLPHPSSKHQRHERAQAAPEGCDNSPQSTACEMQTSDSSSEAERRNNLSHGSHSTLSFHSNKYTGRSNVALHASQDSSKVEVALPGHTDDNQCVEMSVDEPETEVCVARPAEPMLHHRIASHVQHGRPLTHRSRSEFMRRSTSFNFRSPAYADDIIRSPRPSEPELRRAKTWSAEKRSHSLDLRRRKENGFLTPDAWIDSLSQENCSTSPSCQPDSPFWKHHRALPRKISKSPASSPPAAQAASLPSPAVDPLSPPSSLEMSVPDPDELLHHEPRRDEPLFVNAAKWPVAYQESMEKAEGYTGATGEESISLISTNNNNDQGGLEVEAGGLEGGPESGGSYSSYASSGRGSMETATGRLSLCHVSSPLISSPEMAEDAPTRSRQMEASQRRKASVDENYEWDAADICPQPGDHDGLLPSLNRLKPALQCRLPSMPCSGEELKNCTRLSLLPGHQSSCSAEPEPHTVLF